MQAVVKFPKILEYVLKSLLPKVIQGLPWKVSFVSLVFFLLSFFILCRTLCCGAGL
jgi:hypothetical protein